MLGTHASHAPHARSAAHSGLASPALFFFLPPAWIFPTTHPSPLRSAAIPRGADMGVRRGGGGGTWPSCTYVVGGVTGCDGMRGSKRRESWCSDARLSCHGAGVRRHTGERGGSVLAFAPACARTWGEVTEGFTNLQVWFGQRVYVCGPPPNLRIPSLSVYYPPLGICRRVA